jgi:hypothetical protein
MSGRLPVTDLAGVLPMDQPGYYLHWGVIQISVANVTVVLLMLLVFGIALVAPFPGRRRR